MLIRSLKLEDLPQVEALLATREGVGAENAPRRSEILKYIAFENPRADHQEPGYFIAEEEGEIIALHGRMPVMFSIRGKYVKGFYVHDLSVHESCLKKGRGLWVTLALAKAIEERSDTFFALFGMTPLNQQMQRRRGYHEIFADSYVKVFRPGEVLASQLPGRIIARVAGFPLKVGLSVADGLVLRLPQGNPPVQEVSVFDERFDRLFDRTSARLGVCTRKNAEYLRWKYGEGPSDDTTLAAILRDEIEGYIVVGQINSKWGKVGVIKDIVADPDRREIIRHLVVSALRLLRDRGLAAVLCIETQEEFAHELKKLLFLRRANHEAVFLGNLDKVPEHKETLMDIRNWHMMFGESDLFMFDRDPLKRPRQDS